MRVNLPRSRLSRMRRLALILIAATITATPCAAEDMATGFVYLRDVDPTILQDMRYAGPYNFTGHAVNGYDAPECVLVREAADALKAVQAEVKTKGLSLKVYDCYRPARAVAARQVRHQRRQWPAPGRRVSALPTRASTWARPSTASM